MLLLLICTIAIPSIFGIFQIMIEKWAHENSELEEACPLFKNQIKPVSEVCVGFNSCNINSQIQFSTFPFSDKLCACHVTKCLSSDVISKNATVHVSVGTKCLIFMKSQAGILTSA